MRRLCAAVIEKAIDDHRTALTRGLISADTRPLRELRSAEAEMTANLFWYFHKGGLEINLSVAGFNIPVAAIRRKIRERYS